MMFRIPIVRGIIERRVLVNFRVAPEVAERILPPPFRPKLVKGWSMAGICLIRLNDIRPRFLPAALGITSENAAHRFAVEWDADGKVREGVFIPRRDTSSRLQVMVGGRLFPGLHHHAHFQVAEDAGQIHIAVNADDGTHLAVSTSLADRLRSTSVFESLEQASQFFERGSLGYSVSPHAGEFDGLELRSFGWEVEPLEMETVESSFFADARRFPKGSVEFDCALLMRGIEHEWHERERIYAPPMQTGFHRDSSNLERLRSAAAINVENVV